MLKFYHLILIFLFTALNINCHNSTKNGDFKTPSDTTLEKDNITSSIKNADTTSTPETHLHDTTLISGNVILFLRPDSARFENIAQKEEGIYDADSDFGVGISNTEKSVAKNKKYSNVLLIVSTNRYVIIKDCKNCPKTIDRDTINYGVILSSKDKQIKTTYGSVHSGNYMEDIDEYFQIK